jgi:hypothetical protein
MLKVTLAAEVLPVGVLHPVRHYVLVAQIVLVFQIMQRHHQTRRDARRPLRGMIRRAQRLFKRNPIDAHPQTDQPMMHIDHLLQFHFEQLTRYLLRLSLRAHAFSPVLGRVGVLICDNYTTNP